MRNRAMFLERRGYRRRRLRDAARVLPVVGALLFLMPLLWSLAPGRTIGTAGGGLYVFGVWAMLVIAAFVLSRRLRSGEGDVGAGGGTGSGTGGGTGGGDGPSG